MVPALSGIRFDSGQELGSTVKVYMPEWSKGSGECALPRIGGSNPPVGTEGSTVKLSIYSNSSKNIKTQNLPPLCFAGSNPA